MIFIDLCLVAGSFFACHWILGNKYGLYPHPIYRAYLPVLLGIWWYLLNFFKMYESFRLRNIWETLFIIFKTSLTGFIVFGAFIYFFRQDSISRIFFGQVFLVAAGVIAVEKIVLILFFRWTRARGLNYRNILIVGTGRRAQKFIHVVQANAKWGLRIIGLIDEDPEKVGQEILGCKVLGVFKDFEDIIHKNVVDEVVFIAPRSWLTAVQHMIYACETEGLKINVAVDYFELRISRAKQTDLDGFPLLSFESAPDKLGHLLVKRVFDMLVSSIALIVLSPFFLMTALVLKLTSKGPVFFKQKRCGLYGRNFTLYKFRTMIPDAEAKLHEIKAHNEMSGPAFKMENDPRITPLGKFLRKWSIDELPQFWNVLRGDMSLIGPRPPIPSEVVEYDNWHRRRLSMRPGLTCLWQVQGRNKIKDFENWMKLDMEYIDNWSLWLDLKIFFKTIPVVLFGVGAK